MPVGSFAAAPLMESLGQAVIATDLDGRVRYWNAGAERMYGWTAAEAVGRPSAELNQPSVDQAQSDEIFDAVRSGGQWSGGLTFRRKDGTVLSALVTDAGIFDDNGDLIGVVAVSGGVGSAVRPVLAHTSDAAVILDPAGRVNHVSPAAARMFGWTDESVAGGPVWELLHRDDRIDAIEHYRAVVSSSVTRQTLECRVLRADGTSCWVDVLFIDLLDDPVVHGVVCNLRDITDRVDERQQRTVLIEQLQTALHSRVEIEQAKGMIAARCGLAVDKAFLVLRRYARDHNLKLHDLARDVVLGEIQLPLTRQPSTDAARSLPDQ
jgi:PAS domain S-box-containing protein